MNYVVLSVLSFLRGPNYTFRLQIQPNLLVLIFDSFFFHPCMKGHAHKKNKSNDDEDNIFGKDSD